MKILVTPTSFLSAQNSEARGMLERFAGEIVYNDLHRPLTEEEVAERLSGVDGYIAGVDYITERAVAKADRLKVVSRYGVGVDRVDLAAANRLGITVTNTPGANSIAVCELAFALMLSAARDIPRLHAGVSAGEWPRAKGFELCGKTLGILGFGAIGRNLAVRARAFGMRVQAADPYFDHAFASQHGVSETDVDTLLSTSDFVSLHVPLTEATRNLIDADRIARMKTGAVIVNTARGGILDEQAAADAIKSGKLGGVGLDAFEQEPPENCPLIGLPGVVLTPHTGANTLEAAAAMGRMAVENLIAVLSGEPCRYIVK